MYVSAHMYIITFVHLLPAVRNLFFFVSRILPQNKLLLCADLCVAGDGLQAGEDGAPAE